MNGVLTLLRIISVTSIGGVFVSLGWPANWLGGQFLGSSPSFWRGPEIFLASLANGIPAKVTYLLVATAPMWFSLRKYSSRIIPGVPWVGVGVVSSLSSY